MDNFTNKLNEIRQYGYDLDFGIAISQAFENYKKIALTVGAIILVLIVLFTVVVGGVAGVAYGVSSFTEFTTNYNVLQHTTSVLVVNFLVTGIGAGLIAPITAGIFKIAHHAETNTEFGFSTAFDYYKTAYFKDLFLSALIIAFFSNGIGLLVTLVSEYIGDYTLNSVLNFFSGVINIGVSLYTLLVIPAIIFGNLNATDAIKASFLLVRKRFWTILVLALVSGILVFVGLIGFCIGIFFTLPFIYSMEYTIYRTAVDIEREDALNEIGSNWDS